MLGFPTRSLDEIYRRLGDLPFSAEFKYDGQRAQIHASSNHNGDCQIKVFSRHLEDMTSKVNNRKMNCFVSFLKCIC
jgi:DNA ligase-1